MKMDLLEIAGNPELMEVARKAIEDQLIDLRDARIANVGRRNGLVVYEKDGKPSNIIRMGPEHAFSLGLTAIVKHLAEQLEKTKK